MKHISAFVLPSLFLLAAAAPARAQYCSPNFPFGCFSWNNQSISIGSLDWYYDGLDCTASDYTDQIATVNAGDMVPMNVVSGTWTGCAVWVDFDNSGSFEESENLYYIYAGGDPSYTYDFVIAIPESTPTGNYRIRVIAPWGSDGFLSSNTNGYGPCGDYQYGNFQDFTLSVIGSTGIATNAANSTSLTTSPNPTDGLLTLTNAGAPLERVSVYSTDGRLVQQQGFTAASEKVQVDLGALASGVYTLQCSSGNATSTVRVVKD